MDIHSLQSLAQPYWSGPELRTNGLVFLNLLGAWLLGALVGYERSYHGRAAGMRTYALVCTASAGLTVMSGYPLHWFGGEVGVSTLADPTRVVQGIVTGIGFLGAGVIMREGLNISGLTTAASIWVAAAIGVLVGVGFYAAAILLAVLTAATMMWGSRLEAWLPSHHALGISLRFVPGRPPTAAALDAFLRQQGYAMARGSLSVQGQGTHQEWKFVAVVLDRRRAVSLDELAQALEHSAQVEGYTLSHARN